MTDQLTGLISVNWNSLGLFNRFTQLGSHQNLGKQCLGPVRLTGDGRFDALMPAGPLTTWRAVRRDKRWARCTYCPLPREPHWVE